MDERHSQQMVEYKTRVVLRPMASPLPLAFFAFGVGSILQSLYQFGLVPADETQAFALVLGLFVFPLQALAAVLSFAARETLGATALGLISGSWLVMAVIMYVSPPNTTTVTLGAFQVCIALILLLLGVIGLQGKPVVSAIILLASARYTLNGLFELTTAPWTQTASGAIGCLVFLFALYGGLALGLEDVKHRPVLPFGRRGEALEAVKGDLGDQIGPVDREAGVRKQL